MTNSGDGVSYSKNEVLPLKLPWTFLWKIHNRTYVYYDSSELKTYFTRTFLQLKQKLNDAPDI